MLRSSRAEYNFPTGLRYERLHGCKLTCEGCGKITKDLQVHHLVACYLASRNIALTPQMIKTLENEMCLCRDCHRKADADQKKWTAHDVAMIAWALFDIDPQIVEQNQTNTYLNKPVEQNKHRQKRRRR